MSSPYRPPEALSAHHGLANFRCRSTEQTDWLRRHARQSCTTGTTRVFVVTEHEQNRVVAYYAWCMAQVRSDQATEVCARARGAAHSRSRFSLAWVSRPATKAEDWAPDCSRTCSPG